MRLLKQKGNAWVLFAIAIAVLLFHFHGLFRAEPLPEFDSSSHAFTLTKMAHDFLPEGRVTGYAPEWLGGIALFDFYAPFYFAGVALAWIVTGGGIPLLLLSRIAIFAVLVLFIVALRSFAGAYADRKTGEFAILGSLAFLFYPYALAQNGIGAGAAIWVGLTAGTFALCVLLFWLATLERLRREPGSTRLRLQVAVLGAILILSHTLTSIAGFFAWFILVAWRWREKRFVRSAGVSMAISMGLSAFWLVPFIAHLPLASGSPLTIAESIGDPLAAIFPFNPRLALDIAAIPYVKFWAFALLVLTAYGAYRLCKEKKPALVILLGAFLLFAARDYGAVLFPGLSIHYSRILPFVFVLSLSIALYGLRDILDRWMADKRRKAIVAVCAASILIHQQMLFAIGVNDFDPAVSDLYAEPQSTAWSFDAFELDAQARGILHDLKNTPGINRVFIQLRPAQGLAYIGSQHYFTSEVPRQNGQSTITGLYLESSPETPFIMPALYAVSRGGLQVWGDARLLSIKGFTDQPFEAHLKRLAAFGVTHVVASAPHFIKDLSEATTSARFIKGRANFKLFALNHPDPIAKRLDVLPVLYIDLDDRLSFREVSLALFAGEKTAATPLAHWNKKRLPTTEEIKDFSFIIASAGASSPEEINALQRLGKPVILLNTAKELIEQLDPSAQRVAIVRFEGAPSRFVNNSREVLWPAGWEDLQRVVADRVRSAGMSETIDVAISDTRIEFRADGPVAVNLGYAPYWHCEGCELYMGGRGTMIVLAKGEAVLTYRADGAKNAGIAVSWAAIAATGFLALRGIKKPRRSAI